MGPVRLAICRTSTAVSERRPDVGAELAASSLLALRFGDDTVYLGRDWSSFAKSAERTGVAVREAPGARDLERLHVVIQKGRLFQREHPDIPVLLDKGRFLLVDIPADQSGAFHETDVPCYSVRPLQQPQAAERERVVFDVHSRGTGRFRAGTPDPMIQALVARLSKTSFEADLAQLVGLPTRHSTSANYIAACDRAEQQFIAANCMTSRQTFSVGSQQSQNVIARRTGSQPGSRGLILVTAHLDSVNHEGTPSSPAPGADDDGSGSAGVLEIARALKEHPGGHDLCFVLFGGEEQGLFGSKHFVQSLSEAERSRITAVVHMDMIGKLNIPTPTVLLEGAPLSQSVIDGLATCAATYTNLNVETSTSAANSDHVSFIRKGVPAVLTIEGADSGNEDIHSARDTIDRISLDLALETLKMNTAFVAEQLGVRGQS